MSGRNSRNQKPPEKAPRKPRESDPDVQLRRAQRLAAQFLRERLLGSAPEDQYSGYITSIAMKLYDSDGFDAYMAWLMRTDLTAAEDLTVQIEIEACFAGYLFGLAVGSLLAPKALPIERELEGTRREEVA